jgi:O-succinylbenzoate synthase
MTYRFAYRRYALPLRSPVRTAHGTMSQREGIWVRLEAEDGTVGYGEAAPLAGFGRETVDADEAWCRRLGATPRADELLAIPEELGCLTRAIEVARDAAAPVAQHAYLPVAALLPAGRMALAKIGPLADLGFRTFKWKVGVADPADERALLTDLLGELPAGAKVRLDANGAWDRRTAERWLERCAEWQVEYIEQPIAADARGAEDLLLGLAGDYPTPLALDESLVGRGDVDHWLERGWSGVYVLKPSLLGGLAACVERLARASAHVVFSSALESKLGARSALRAAFAWTGETRALGFGVWPLFADTRYDGPASAPFIRVEDVERIDPEAVWTALN